MSHNTVSHPSRLRQVVSILTHSVTVGCYLLATMLLLEYLWSGTLSGLRIYLVITGLFVALMTLARCNERFRRVLKA